MFGITMGDASGIGPEIIIRSYRHGTLPAQSIVFGDYTIMQKCADILEIDIPMRRISAIKQFEQGALNILDAGLLSVDDLTIGQISAKSGYAALKYVESATLAALDCQIDAIITLPMNKEATRLSDANFTGHTEFIADLCETTQYTMMLASDKLLVTHVSTHVSLLDAISRIRQQRILDVINLTAVTTNKLRPQCRIAVAGLNPHAGESGAFGAEEQQEIAPAIASARAQGLSAIGPAPPDTIFYEAISGQYDAVVCMYHDQGHIPMKLLAFDSAVNITLGLPIIRTSVDHGTAYNIAYQGKASTRSFENACSYAEKLHSKDKN